MTTATAAPVHIEADSYAGKWQTVKADRSRGKTWTLGWLPAGELAEQIGHGQTGVIWGFSGTPRGGGYLFTRSRVLAWNGDLHGFDADGRKIIVHPADRVIRYLGGLG